MEPQQAKIDEIFHKAAEIAAEERPKYLDQVCGDDPQLRERVERLLAAQSKVDSFLESPAPGAVLGPTIDQPSSGSLGANQPLTEKPGTKIGPYKLLQKLGEGGMGVVYMAEQKTPVSRRAALKIIKPGMDTRQVIARFEAERQALAMMDHPNIAHVLDAGTTDSGRPYFAMELVKGVPITQFCDEKRLNLEQRLDLFVDVCHAVQHAHQKGIIHRDIKPSNVLVAEYDDLAVPKIIDFGVAKAVQQQLTEKTMFTQVGQVVGTLEYMSPEQAKLNQLDIDTRSDIYSLGVLLYELLTGATPFDRKRLQSAAFDEMLRILREEEPPKPSTKLSSSETLPSIAANRHVEPRKLSVLVRGELDWIVMKAREKDRSRRYDTANAFASDIANYLNDEAVQACPPSAAYRFGKFARRNKVPLLISTAAALVLILVAFGSIVAALRFEKMASENAQLFTEKSSLAENLQAALTDSQTNLIRARDQEQKAKENFALASTEQQRAEGNLDLALKALDAVYLDAIGTEKLLGEPRSKPQSEGQQAGPSPPPPLSDLEKQLLRRGLTFYDRFAQQNVDTRRADLQTGRAHYRVGLLHAALGDHHSAVTAYRAAIERFQQLNEEKPKDVRYLKQLASAYKGLGHSLPDWADAKRAYQAAQRAYTKAIELKPNDAALLLNRAEVLGRFGDQQQRFKDLEHAVQLEPENLKLLRSISNYYQHAMSPSQRDRDKALEYAERAVALAPDDPHSVIRLAQIFAWEKDVVRIKSSTQLIVDDRQRALELFNRAVELAPKDAGIIATRGSFFDSLGDHNRALEDLNRALEIDPQHHWHLFKRASVHRARGDLKAALDDLGAAIALFPHERQMQMAVGEIYLQQSKWRQALEALDKAIAIAPGYWVTYKRRAQAHAKLGDHAATLEDLKTAFKLNPGDTSTLIWLGKSVARGPDEFHQGLLALAEEMIQQSTEPAVALAHRARLHVHLNHHELAEADFARAVELDPDKAAPWNLWGLYYGGRGEEDQGREKYAEAIKRNPQHWLYWSHHGMASYRLDDFATARDDFTKVLELSPHDENACKWRAAAHFRLGKFDEALADLKLVLHLNPRKFGVIVWITPEDVAKCSNESFQQGLIALADQVVEKTQDPRPYMHRARLLRALGKNDQADRDLLSANQLAGNDAGLQMKLAQLHRNAGNDHQALVHFTKAVELDPSEPQNWNHRGMCLHRLGRHKEARDSYSEAIERNPYVAAFWSNRALTQLNLRAYEQVINDASRAIDLKGNHQLALKWRARAYVALQRWPEATVDYARLIRIEPNEPMHLLNRGRFLLASGDETAAQADFDAYLQLYHRAVEEKPDQWQAFNHRGVALTRLERWDAAVADFRKAAELAPEEPGIYRNWAAALVPQDRWQEAADTIKKVVELRPDDWGPAYELALCSLGAGDVDRYRDVCARMIKNSAETKDALQASFTAWTCALAPAAVEDYQPLVNLASDAVNQSPDDHFCQKSLGAVLYRASRYDEALEALTKIDLEDASRSSGRSSPAYTWYFLAMTRHALGETNAAQLLIAKANDWTDKVLSNEDEPPAWNRRLTLELLQREANRAVGQDLSWQN